MARFKRFQKPENNSENASTCDRNTLISSNLTKIFINQKRFERISTKLNLDYQYFIFSRNYSQTIE